MPNGNDVIVLIAGNGKLPLIVSHELTAKKKNFFVLCFDGENLLFFKKQKIEAKKISLHDLPKIIELIKQKKATKAICCGGVKYVPNKNKFDVLKIINVKIAFCLLKTFFSKKKGDDFLLSMVEKIFASIGCEVVAVQDILPNLLCNSKDEVFVEIAKKYKKDIEYGKNILQTLSKYDIGQAIVVQNGRILGIEGAEGTAELIRRCGEYANSNKKKPVLIKTMKLNQNKKLDVPSIGVETIKELTEHNYAGVAIEKGAVFIIEKEKVLELAKDAGIFIKII